jgi:hypothetical protein
MIASPRIAAHRPLGLSFHRIHGTKGSRKNNFTVLCADASCLAVLPKRRNILIFLRFGALPGRRLNT